MQNKTVQQPIIEVKGLQKSFGSLLVLDKISFSINKGAIFSILGPSGSGKTTLLKCLIGLESSTGNENTVSVMGMPLKNFLNKQRIAYVPQRYSNYPWLSVFENIKLGMINHNDLTFTKKKKKQMVQEIIETVGLGGFEKYTIDKLSGGMQQRVAIGRALAQNTDIIAFDEPFGALDFKIRETLQLLVKKLDKTILFVTHDIEEAVFIADKLIVLSKIPTSITNEYNLPFRSMLESSVKFEDEFIAYRKEIQQNFSQADDLITELRKTGEIRSLSIEKVLSFPFLDSLRNLVNEDTDKEIIMNLFRKDGDDFQIGVMLLRNFKENVELKNILMNRFNNNHLSAKSNFFLLHELSYRTDDNEERKNIWRFIKDHYEEYKQWEVNEYFKGKQNTIDGCKQRLYKPEHKNKRWIYLISLAGTKMLKAKEIIEEYVDSDDKFLSEIAQELLAKTDWQ